MNSSIGLSCLTFFFGAPPANLEGQLMQESRPPLLVPSMELRRHVLRLLRSILQIEFQKVPALEETEGCRWNPIIFHAPWGDVAVQTCPILVTAVGARDQHWRGAGLHGLRDTVGVRVMALWSQREPRIGQELAVALNIEGMVRFSPFSSDFDDNTFLHAQAHRP